MKKGDSIIWRRPSMLLEMRSQHRSNVSLGVGPKDKITQESVGKIGHVSYKWRQT